jgi:hypothetical protein
MGGLRGHGRQVPSTVSALPARAVPGYHGSSPYLLVSKYNYLGLEPHGDGHNEVAVLDPRSSQKDPYANVRVMKAVQTILSPVHVPGAPAGARYEKASTRPWSTPPTTR